MKDRLIEVLTANRYGIEDVAKWLGTTYQTAWNKVNGNTKWYYEDIVAIKQVLGKKNIDYIFFKD